MDGAGKKVWAWDSTNGVWVKLAVNTSGHVIVKKG